MTSPPITAGARYRCKHCPSATVSTPDAARMLGWRIWSGKTMGGEQREDVVCPACAGTGPRTPAPTTPRMPYRPPQDERHHYLFVDPCGCPRGLTEASAETRGGPPRLADEDAAWDDAYTRSEARKLRRAGVRVVHVDHATYERDWFDLMRGPCPHATPTA